MPPRLRIAAAVVLSAVLAAGLGVACFPEPPARLLTGPDGWELRGGGQRVPLKSFAGPYVQLRRSVLDSPGGLLYRSYTPEGLRDIVGVSPPFRAPRHLSVAITGATRTWTGRNVAYLECSRHPGTLPIFTGSVNVNATEALVDVPSGWCDGETRAVIRGGDLGVNVGMGSVFAVSTLSAWKSSFVGLLPYLAVTIAVIGAFMLLGAAAIRRWLPAVPAQLAAALALGLAMPGAFFLGALARPPAVGIAALAALLALWGAAGRDRIRDAARALAPYGWAWSAAALGYFALLTAARNGLGHWESHYRFWPAAWSSDGELPWLFAEALRTRVPLPDLLVGWRITDRPPLLAGGHLLVADALDLLQLGNDGRYLRGLAYDTAAIAFNALWVPALLFLLRSVLRQPRAHALRVVAALGILPFSIFNTIFGWPKALGAAFGVLATAVAVQLLREDEPGDLRVRAALFGALSGLSLLAHGSGAVFLLPVGAWLVLRVLGRRPAALAAGVIPGAALLASWSLYQRLVYPSQGPLTKYALTGDYGFDGSKTLWAMLVERYRSFTLAGWLDIKARIFLQPLLPIDQPVAQMHLNEDHGADLLGTLRAWDFDLLVPGNAAIVLAALAVFLWRRRAARAGAGEGSPFDAGAARTLVAFAGATWVVLTLLFLAPIVVHTWPYAAFFVAGAAGLAWLAETAPPAFAALAGASALYSAVVWLVGPLRTSRDLDPVAVVVFLLVTAGIAASLRGSGSPERSPAGDEQRSRRAAKAAA
jgi:hypothetical protein